MASVIQRDRTEILRIDEAKGHTVIRCAGPTKKHKVSPNCPKGHGKLKMDDFGHYCLSCSYTRNWTVYA